MKRKLKVSFQIIVVILIASFLAALVTGCMILLVLAIMVTLVCGILFFSGSTLSAIPTAAGFAGAKLCLRALRAAEKKKRK